MKHKRELVLSVSCFLFALLLTMIWVRQRDENLAAKISDEILRFHVLANSNDNDDQQLKLEVKSLLIQTINEGLKEDADKADTSTYIQENQEYLERTAETYMKEAGYDYPAKVELTNTYFPTKAYGDVVLPCGNYDAARVTIGQGRGRNWWCVLYPQLCFVTPAYGVIPDDSKELLKAVLEPDDYRALLNQRMKYPKREIRFKILELLDLS